MARAAYIHIPFCAHKCDFCDFAAFAGVDDLTPEYCDVVVKEISERISLSPNMETLKSVFYGGGTPGYIPPQELRKVHETLAKAVGLEEGAEVTLETTPQSVTVDKAKAWLEMGINRLSIGVESLNDDELKAMGRDHTSDQALAGIERARQGGFENIAIDLMYGLPEQTLSSWQETLGTALSLQLPHLSAYGLTISGNSPLLSRYPLTSQAYPVEDTFVEMYKMLLDESNNAGLHQYEISNFSHPGHQSRHNLTYWSNDEYLAFGVSAHRYVGGVRSSNFRSLRKYMRDPLGNETYEVIDEKTRAKEAIFLGLRRTAGIDLEHFREEYGFDIEMLLADKIKRLSDGGFVTVENGCLKLSPSGILVSNLVLAELI
jgi:putative oxygen-independent coproporphyrinogen III oxidase